MRHKNISTIFLVQNLYFKSKYMTTVTKNAQYMIIFENPRDGSIIKTLGRQVYTDKPKFLPNAFTQAMSKPYGYLFLDFKPGGDKSYRVREGILPGEQTYVYLPKSDQYEHDPRLKNVDFVERHMHPFLMLEWDERYIEPIYKTGIPVGSESPRRQISIDQVYTCFD